MFRIDSLKCKGKRYLKVYIAVLATSYTLLAKQNPDRTEFLVFGNHCVQKQLIIKDLNQLNLDMPTNSEEKLISVALGLSEG